MGELAAGAADYRTHHRITVARATRPRHLGISSLVGDVRCTRRRPTVGQSSSAPKGKPVIYLDAVACGLIEHDGVIVSEPLATALNGRGIVQLNNIIRLTVSCNADKTFRILVRQRSTTKRMSP
jgi:hypothetical protein